MYGDGVKATSYDQLHDRTERGCARLAAIARNDTIFGGARAMVLAQRLSRLNSPIPAHEIVGDVYSASTGRWHPTWEAFECRECGQARLGLNAAMSCCDEFNDGDLSE